MKNMQAYMKQRRLKRKLYIIDKLGGKCSNCEETENLQFDHIDRTTKVMGIADMLSHALVKLEEEIKKCQLLCQSCHTKKTIKDFGFRDAKTEHGTPRSILYCKCEVCRKAHRERVYAWRRKTGRH